MNGVSLEACSITDAARLLQTSEEIVTLRIQKPDEEIATPLSDEGMPSCCQSDLEIVHDDEDNDFGSPRFGRLDDIAQDEEFLSQSADESISHLPLGPSRRYLTQKIKKAQQNKRAGNTSASSRMHQFQQAVSEVGLDRRDNASESLSSDRLSENACSGESVKFPSVKHFAHCASDFMLWPCSDSFQSEKARKTFMLT